MAHPTLTPLSSMPTDPPTDAEGDAAGAVELGYTSGADIYVTDGDGTYCLIQYFNGSWWQYGPEWTLPAPAGQGQVARLALPQAKAYYHVLRKSGTGGEEESAVILGVNRG